MLGRGCICIHGGPPARRFGRITRRRGAHSAMDLSARHGPDIGSAACQTLLYFFTGRIRDQSRNSANALITRTCCIWEPRSSASSEGASTSCGRELGLGLTQSVIETRSMGTISLDSAKRALSFDLHTAAAQTPQNATWVQAERRRRGVGRAAWMPREPPPAMDGGWRRAHGASPE